MPSEVVTRLTFPSGHPLSICQALAESLVEAEKEHNLQEAANIFGAMNYLRCGEPQTGEVDRPDPGSIFQGEPEVYLTIVSRKKR
jgi:hypothetical protein